MISDPVSGQVSDPLSGGFSKGKGPSTFTSYVNGQNVAGALNLEFDIPVTGYVRTSIVGRG